MASTRFAISFSTFSSRRRTVAAVALGWADSRALAASTSAANTATISGDSTSVLIRSIKASFVSLAPANAFIVQPVPRQLRCLLQLNLELFAIV